MQYFVGVDIGSSKTHVAIADQAGQIVGFGQAGAGNNQVVGYDGMLRAVQEGLAQALAQAQIGLPQIAGAGFGIAGYDWPSQDPAMRGVLNQLGLACPMRFVNDGVPPLLAASEDGWGISLIAGTGCNCRGLDRTREREGRVTGYGYHMGEFAGASELVWRAMQLVAFAWTKRGQPTALSDALITFAGAKNLADLLEGYTEGHLSVNAKAAPLVFEVAQQGDVVAQELLRWAGQELAEMAKAVIRQLEFEQETFDVVLSGSLFKGGPLLIDPMWQAIIDFAPQARLVHLTVPPVMGSVILGMAQASVVATAVTRQNLINSLVHYYDEPVES
ncbi:MAG: ATPase [Ardenticatenaceae bacterium]|nr:ATPase [Ardenticatenaceae bacterium]